MFQMDIVGGHQKSTEETRRLLDEEVPTLQLKEICELSVKGE